MTLIIFPIIIGLCVLGLIFLVFKKIPQIVNHPIEPLIAVPLNSTTATPSETPPQKILVWKFFFDAIKKQYLKMFQSNWQSRLKINSQAFFLKMKRGFAWIIKNILALAREIRPAVLSKKKIVDWRQRLAIRKKGDFNQLKEFFNKKKSTLILPQITPKGDKDSNPMEVEETDKSIASLRASQEHLDFKKFLNNGEQEKKSYKLEKLSFDQLFKKTKPETSKPKITESNNEPAGLGRNKKDTALSKFIQKEQALIQEIAEEPRNAGLYAKLGELYLKVKNWQDAKASFNYLLELEPQNKKALKALDKINKMLHNQ